MGPDRQSGERDWLILIVDDDAGLRTFVAMWLAAAGLRVATASHGLEIVDRVLLVKPDVIILDLEMPGLNGQAVLEALKSDLRTRAVPVVMFSGASDDTWRSRALRDGSMVCLAKPGSPEQILDAIETALTAAHQTLPGDRMQTDELSAQMARASRRSEPGMT